MEQEKILLGVVAVLAAVAIMQAVQLGELNAKVGAQNAYMASVMGGSSASLAGAGSAGTSAGLSDYEKMMQEHHGGSGGGASPAGGSSAQAASNLPTQVGGC